MTRYRVLGSVEVETATGPVALGGRKQRAVLAALVLDVGRVVSADRLAGVVWGDDHPASAANSLQAYVSHLRRVLRDATRATTPIVRKGSSYLLDVRPGDTDLGEFLALAAEADQAVARQEWAAAVETAERAAALWRGPFLAEYRDEEWVRVAAGPVEDRVLAVGQSHVVGLLGLGRTAQAVGRSRGLLAERPLDERACWLHALALHQAGRSGEALDALREHRTRIDEELGLDVGPALRDLQAAILRQDPALAHWPRSPRPAAAPAVVEPAAPAPDAEPRGGTAGPGGTGGLVGRDREVATLREALAGHAAHGARWIALTGTAGIGKSRLAEEVASWWPASGRVVRADCPDDDGVPSHWPLRQVLTALGADADAVLTPPVGTDADAARFAVYDAVRASLLAAVASQPVLLLVEDVHWADPATLRVLAHLCSTDPGDLPGLVCVVTARDGEGGPEVARLLLAMARRPGSRLLGVPPLEPVDVAALVSQISGRAVGSREARELADRTGGNAFFVSEYARLADSGTAAGDVPVAVRSVLGRRLATVDPDVLQVLRTAAVIGEHLDVDLLARVTRLDRGELAELLDDAADEHLIVATPGSGEYAFVHALMREEVLSTVSAMRRQRLHLRVADAVDPGQPTRRANHLVAAGPLADPAAVLQACREAAQDADRRWHPGDAADWWGRAVEVVDQLSPTTAAGGRDDLVVARLDALARSGRGQTVLDVVDDELLQAVRERRFGSVGRFAASLLRTSGSWPWASFGEDPAPLLARLRGVEPLVAGEPAAHVRVLAALAVGSCYDPDPDVPDELSRRALDAARALADDDVLADALLGRALTYSGVATHAAECLQLLTELDTLAHRTAELDRVIAHGLSFMARLVRGETEQAAEHARAGALGSDLLRLATSRVQFRWAEATLELWRADDLAATEERFRQALDLHRQTELYATDSFHVAVSTLRWDQGRLAADDYTLPGPRSAPWAIPVRAAATGAPEAATLLAAEVRRPTPPVWNTHGRLTMLAHAVADVEAAELAPELLAKLGPYLPFVANIGQIGVVGPVALAAARLHLLLGDLDAARAANATARALAERGGAPGSVLRCEVLDLQFDVAEGRPVDADRLRRLGLAARRRGMHDLVEVVDAFALRA